MNVSSRGSPAGGGSGCRVPEKPVTTASPRPNIPLSWAFTGRAANGVRRRSAAPAIRRRRWSLERARLPCLRIMTGLVASALTSGLAHRRADTAKSIRVDSIISTPTGTNGKDDVHRVSHRWAGKGSKRPEISFSFFKVALAHRTAALMTEPRALMPMNYWSFRSATKVSEFQPNTSRVNASYQPTASCAVWRRFSEVSPTLLRKASVVLKVPFTGLKLMAFVNASLGARNV